MCCLSMFWEESYEDTRTRGEGKKVQGTEKGIILVIVLKPDPAWRDDLELEPGRV